MKRRVGYSILTIPAFGVLYFLTFLSVITILMFALMKQEKTVLFLTRYWAKSIFRVLGKKLHVEGCGNFEKGNKYILIANHSSLFDIMAVLAFFPGVSWFGREYLLRIPVFGFLLKKMHYIPMRQADYRNTLRMVEQLVQNGDKRSIAIFPEGTRTTNGKINRFHKGFLYVLKASKSDILPVTLNGFYRLKPKNRFNIDFSARLQVIVHQPLPYEEMALKSDVEIIKMVKEVIESANNH
jgi:1-acyl-sn-glycerol-3-phosphate acyltransferase